MTPKFYINNKLVREPVEYRGMELELNFEDADEVQTAVTQEKFTWTHENADLLNQYLTDGTTGNGLGIYWGVPFRIEIGSQVLFEGYIDLVNDAEFSCEKVISHVRENGEPEGLEERLDGFSFALLYSKGIITNSDFVAVPYIQSDIPDYKQAALFFLYAYVIGRELERLIKDIANVASDLSGVFSTIAGVLKLIFLVVYLVALIIAIISVIKQMLSELIQPVRYHLGMTAKKHFEKICQYKGWTFQSSLFDPNTATNNELAPGLWENLLLLPEKNKPGFKRNQTTLQHGYFNGTCGDWIRGMAEVFNARTVLKNNVLRFERRDYGSSTAVYKIPDVKRVFYGTNADELISNYLIQFQVDNLDLNTVNRYAGTNAKNYITSKTKDSTKTELIGGLHQPKIPFALGRRKNELTRVEQLVKAFLPAVDAVLSVVYPLVDGVLKGVNAVVKFINKIIGALNTLPGVNIKKINAPAASVPKNTLSQTMDKRIGMLALSDDMFGVPKLILVEGAGLDVKITTDNETKLSAETLWNKYHYLESMVPSATRPAGNQAFKYQVGSVPFCYEDYLLVRGLNNQNQSEAKVVSPEGRPARIKSIKWNIYNNKATIRYYEEKLFTVNLEETLLINQGE